MNKIVRISVFTVFLLVLLYPQAASARLRGIRVPADLVVVLNTKPSNPLGGEIWLMDLKGKLVRRVTKNNYHEEYPKFSPDGNKIVFVRNMGRVVSGIGIDPKQNEIFVYDLRTRVETRLTRNKVEDGHPAWSYDGIHIVFYSRRDSPDQKATLWIMRSNGSRPRQVSSLLPGDLSHVDPDWGPDGNWLAFVSHREEGGVRYSRIERVRVDGSQRTVVSSGGKYLKQGRQQPLGDLEPDYSPDGAMIWSTRRLEGGPVRLFAFGANTYYGGKSERNMSWPVHPDAIERSPSFSPDGRRIILTRSSRKFGHRTRQLVLTDPHSSFRRYLTSREDWDVWHPSWHPSAQSGAERERASTVVHYMARIPTGSNPVPLRKSKEKVNLGNGSVRRLETAKNIHFVVSRLQPSGPKSNKKSSYRVKWKLGIPPKKVISLTLKFEGKLNGFSSEGRSLRFQLMDWRKKKWVTIFRHQDVTNDNIKITHEFTPINFISRNSHQVLLRIDFPGKRVSSNLTLESDHLSLDVRRN